MLKVLVLKALAYMRPLLMDTLFILIQEAQKVSGMDKMNSQELLLEEILAQLLQL